MYSWRLLHAAIQGGVSSEACHSHDVKLNLLLGARGWTLIQLGQQIAQQAPQRQHRQVLF